MKRPARDGAFGALLLVAACGAPAESRPDRLVDPLPPSRFRQPEAKPEVLPPNYGIDVDAFAKDVVAAWRRNPLPIVVLPAFSDDPRYARGTQVFANGAGDWLAAQVLDALRAADPTLEVWAPEVAVVELLRSNRSLRDVRATQDVIALFTQTEAGYVVYGNIEKETQGGRLSGRTCVRVRLLGANLLSGEVIASREHAIEAADAVRDLAARSERASVLSVGARAPEFTPSLDAEIVRTTERALVRLLDTHREWLAGKRCAVSVELPAAERGRALVSAVRSTLLSRAPRALPGNAAISVVDAASAHDIVLTAALERGADRYRLVLAVQRPGERESVRVSLPIDPRFHAELERALS